MSYSLADLEHAWANDPKGKKRHMAGRHALSGFLYQLYLSLDSFFDALRLGDPNAVTAFESLSDLAQTNHQLIVV